MCWRVGWCGECSVAVVCRENDLDKYQNDIENVYDVLAMGVGKATGRALIASIECRICVACARITLSLSVCLDGGTFYLHMNQLCCGAHTHTHTPHNRTQNTINHNNARCIRTRTECQWNRERRQIYVRIAGASVSYFSLE